MRPRQLYVACPEEIDKLRETPQTLSTKLSPRNAELAREVVNDLTFHPFTACNCNS